MYKVIKYHTYQINKICNFCKFLLSTVRILLTNEILISHTLEFRVLM